MTYVTYHILFIRKKIRNSNRHFIKSVWIKQILHFRFVLIHLSIYQLRKVFKLILETRFFIGRELYISKTIWKSTWLRNLPVPLEVVHPFGPWPHEMKRFFTFASGPTYGNMSGDIGLKIIFKNHLEIGDLPITDPKIRFTWPSKLGEEILRMIDKNISNKLSVGFWWFPDEICKSFVKAFQCYADFYPVFNFLLLRSLENRV